MQSPKQKQKAIKMLIGIGILVSALIVSIIGYFIYDAHFRYVPEFNLKPDVTKIYEGSYDSLFQDSIGISFKHRSGGQLKKDFDSNEDDSTAFEKIDYTDETYVKYYVKKQELTSLQLFVSLETFKTGSLNFSVLKDQPVAEIYSNILKLKRNDVFFIDNKIIRVLEKTQYSDNKTPVTTVEVLEGDKEEITKVFLNILQLYLSSKNKFAQEDLEKYPDKSVLSFGNSNSKLFTLSGSEGLSFQTFHYIYNTELSLDLQLQKLEELGQKYKEKYDFNLRSKDKELLFENISQNVFFATELMVNQVVFQEGHIYFIDMTLKNVNVNLDEIKDGTNSTLPVKDIVIYENTENIKGRRVNFNDISFFVPDIFSIVGTQNGSNYNGDELLISPSIMNYENGKIQFYLKDFDNNEMNDLNNIINQDIENYLSESYKIRNKNIENIKLQKVIDIQTGFDISKEVTVLVLLTSGEKVYVKGIYLGNNGFTNYYYGEFLLNESEKRVLPYYNILLQNIKKI